MKPKKPLKRSTKPIARKSDRPKRESVGVQMFPRPGDVQAKKEAVHIYPDGREECNTKTAEGMKEYRNRVRLMLERQGGICCLHGWIRTCRGRLAFDDATFEHEAGRTSGHRDDRIEVDGKWQNGAAHGWCNSEKGSRKIPYNNGPKVFGKA